METNQVKKSESFPIVNAFAAGIDVGSKSHYVAIGQQKEDVREFGCYTGELHSLCRWLTEQKISTVALESTGSYWQSLFVLLQDYGLNPILVNGKFTKNVKGRKTDVLDCQWIQKLHSLGLLEGSYLPDLHTEKLRQYCRHRQILLHNAGDYVRRMQQCLRLTNIRLDVAIRDIVGLSGRAILEAIIAGETNAEKLASLAHVRVKKSKEEIAKALMGDFREEYIFSLKQDYEVYQFFEMKIAECDIEIERILNERISHQLNSANNDVVPYNAKKKRSRKNDFHLNAQELSFNILGGVDLSEIEGIGGNTLMSILSEVGGDMSKFPSAKHFTSWLRLSPNNKISGGKILYSKTNSLGWCNRIN